MFLLVSLSPRTAVVVVKKRINERFFSARGALNNPPPGTVIDHEVTRPEWYVCRDLHLPGRNSTSSITLRTLCSFVTNSKLLINA